MSAKSDILKAMQECGEGTFTPIDGVTYGFALENGKCVIFDTAETDDYREETFGSAESALDGFKINGKSLGSFAGIRVEPCRTV